MVRKPKILFFDVETKPVKVWTFGLGKSYITHDKIVEDEKFDIICICYKWYGEKTVHSLDWGLKKQNSAKMIEEFTKVVESADVVIGHNGDRFDIKQVNTQRMLHGQAPIAWPTSEDTLKQFRKHFYLASNRLDYISKLLFGEGKDPMCLQDWIDIVDKKCSKALQKMIKYCKRDVNLLEKAFRRVEPFLTPRANRSLITNEHKEGCPACGSKDLVKNGTKLLRSGKYQVFRCKKCAHTFKGRKVA